MEKRWRKSSPGLVERYACAFVGGNMFMGLFEENLFVRLGSADRTRLLAEDGAAVLEPMPGRPMQQYIVVPPDLVDDDDEMRAWARRSLAYGAALPPKVIKVSRPAAKAKPAAAKTMPAAARAKPAAAKAKPAAARPKKK